MRLFDTHAHLSDERLSEDLPNVLEKATQAGVERVLLPSSNLEDSYRIVEIVNAYPKQLWGSVGVHPHDAKTYDEQTSQALMQLLESPQIVAVGEIGLDYHYDFSPRETQKEVFRKQIELAYEAQKPLILHDREAHGDFLVVLQEADKHGLLLEHPGVAHCYSGSWEFAKELLKLGFYLGFDGPITYKNARQPHEVIRQMPKDRLLIETDSPYLSPVPYRGKRNEPAYVIEVAKKVAELWDMTVEDVAELSFNNGMRLFFR